VVVGRARPPPTPQPHTPQSPIPNNKAYKSSLINNFKKQF